jgi:mannose-6-phosphate isomerase-like protein (cupin superfamily)
MAAYTKLNFKHDVEDMAPKFDLSPGAESRFARVPLALEQSGLSYFKLAPGFRFPFGHTHGEQEEVYVLISGNAVLRLDDEELPLERLDAVRIPAGTKRAVEGGPDGCELLAFGAPNTENKDAELHPGFFE